MKMYSSIANASVPVHVDYICCYCETANADESQSVDLKAQSHGSLSPSEKLDNEARDLLSRKAALILQELSGGEYQSAHLTCTCSKCGKRQPWASYRKIPIWAIVLFVVGVLMILFMLFNWEKVIIGPRLLIFPVFLMPLLVFAIHNLIVTKKVSGLDRRYLPRIAVRKTSSATSRFAEEEAER